MTDSLDQYICIDYIVPQEKVWEARQKAIEENPSNGSGAEAALLRRKRWHNNRQLHIAFLEGTPFMQKKVIFYAQQWCQYANVSFLFDNHPQAEIRITFQANKGTWSAIGTDAYTIPYYQPTMNFSWLEPTSTDKVFSHTVLHEFGHVLGLIHEHQGPQIGIQWNRDAVIKAHPGCSQQWVEQNIFKHYSFAQTQYTHFDPYSIMLYYIPASWTLDGFQTSINTELSQTDKDFIRHCYPGKG
jgi:serralysin